MHRQSIINTIVPIEQDKALFEFVLDLLMHPYTVERRINPLSKMTKMSGNDQR